MRPLLTALLTLVLTPIAAMAATPSCRDIEAIRRDLTVHRPYQPGYSDADGLSNVRFSNRLARKLLVLARASSCGAYAYQTSGVFRAGYRSRSYQKHAELLTHFDL